MLRVGRLTAGRGRPNREIGYETVLAGDDARMGAIMAELSEIWSNNSGRGHCILVPPDLIAPVSRQSPLLPCEVAIVCACLGATKDISPDVNEETEG
jgi:hypothetical protein